MIETIIENLKQEIELIIDIGLDIEMKEVFRSFDNIKKFEEEKIIYKFISAREDMKGFYCEIIFNK